MRNIFEWIRDTEEILEVALGMVSALYKVLDYADKQIAEFKEGIAKEEKKR